VVVISNEPFRVAGLEVAGHQALHASVALNVVAEIEIGNGYQKVRAGVAVHGDCASGLEFELGSADGIFDEKDLLRAVIQDCQSTVFIPFGRGATEGFVLKQFDRDIAEGPGADIANEVCEGSGRKPSVAFAKFHRDGRLLLDGVGDFGRRERDRDVVMTVPVSKGFGIGINLDIKDTDRFVFKGEMVVRLVGDFHFRGSRLSAEERSQEAEDGWAVHAGDCSIGENRLLLQPSFIQERAECFLIVFLPDSSRRSVYDRHLTTPSLHLY
jgi:hypothetical protein